MIRRLTTNVRELWASGILARRVGTSISPDLTREAPWKLAGREAEAGRETGIIEVRIAASAVRLVGGAGRVAAWDDTSRDFAAEGVAFAGQGRECLQNNR